MPVVICEMCTLPVFQNDATTIQLEHKGVTHAFVYHNRGPSDCLAQKIQVLRDHFTQEVNNEEVSPSA